MVGAVVAILAHRARAGTAYWCIAGFGSYRVVTEQRGVVSTEFAFASATSPAADNAEAVTDLDGYAGHQSGSDFTVAPSNRSCLDMRRYRNTGSRETRHGTAALSGNEMADRKSQPNCPA
jgi:hypothetical protein